MACAIRASASIDLNTGCEAFRLRGTQFQGGHTALDALLLVLAVENYCLRARRRASSAVWPLWLGIKARCAVERSLRRAAKTIAFFALFVWFLEAFHSEAEV
jgi:hypothetical protein